MLWRMKFIRKSVALIAAVIGAIAVSIGSGVSAKADAIKLGAPIPITGPYSSDGLVMQHALELSVAEQNEKGGLLGRPIEMIVFDIGDLTPDKLQAAGTNLVDKEGVDVLINGYGGMGPDIPAFCPYAQPYIHNDATSNVVPLMADCPNIFMGADVDVNYGRIVFEQMTAMGYEFPSKTMAIVEGPYDWEFGNTGGAKAAAEAAGWEIVAYEKVEYGISEWGAILTKLREANPSLIFLEVLDPVAVNTFVDQFNTDPAKGSLLYVGYTGSVPAFSEVVERGIAEGVLGMTLSAQIPGDEAGDAFVARWREAYNEDPPFSIAAQIYDEFAHWVAAVNQVGAVDDYLAIADALRSITLEGVTGTIKFNEQQFVYSSDETVPTHLLQVQGGKVVQIMIGSKKYADFVRPSWLE